MAAPVSETTNAFGESTDATNGTIAPDGVVVAGELLELSVSIDAGAGNAIQWPENFSEVADVVVAGQTRLAVAYKIATASEPANYTVNWGVSEDFCLGLRRVSGVDTADPIGRISPAAVDGSTYADPAFPAIDQRANTLFSYLSATGSSTGAGFNAGTAGAITSNEDVAAGSSVDLNMGSRANASSTASTGVEETNGSNDEVLGLRIEYKAPGVAEIVDPYIRRHLISLWPSGTPAPRLSETFTANALLMLFLGVDAPSGSGDVFSVTNWTKLSDLRPSDASTAHAVYHRKNATPANEAVSMTTDDTSEQHIVHLVEWANVDADNPIGAFATSSSVSNVDPNWDSITTEEDASIAVAFSNSDVATNLRADPTNGYTNYHQMTDGFNSTCFFFKQIPTAGATGSLTVNIANGEYSAVHFELKKAVPQQNQSFEPPTAELMLSGFAPTVEISAHSSISVPSADLALSTSSPGFLVSDLKQFAPPNAELTLEGSAPFQGLSVTPPATHLALSSSPPIVLGTENRTMIPPSRSLTLDTFAVVQDLSVSAPAGDLLLTSFAPASAASEGVSIDVPATSLAFTTFAPQQGIEVVVPSASLTITPAIPASSVTDNVDRLPDSATLVLTTFAVTQDISVFVPAGDLSLTAQTPSANATDNREITPPAGEIMLSAAAPDVTLAIIRQPAQGILTLSGFQPLRTATDFHAFFVPARDLALTPSAPLVVAGAGANIETPAAQLVLSATAPEATRTELAEFTPPSADLLLSSHVPIVAATDFIRAIPDAANLTLSAEAPELTVQTGVLRQPAAAQLSLAGATPFMAATARVSITIPSGVLNLSTTPPNRQIAITVDVPAADLFLEPSPPLLAMTANLTVEIPTASLVLSSFAPAALATANVMVEVPAANLSLSGFTPLVIRADLEITEIILLDGVFPLTENLSGVFRPSGDLCGVFDTSNAVDGVFEPDTSLTGMFDVDEELDGGS